MVLVLASTVIAAVLSNVLGYRRGKAERVAELEVTDLTRPSPPHRIDLEVEETLDILGSNATPIARIKVVR